MGDIVSRFIADPAVSTTITASVAAVIALWLLAALWVHADAGRRTGSELGALAASGWILLSTPLLLPLSLAAYAFVRPAEPVGDRRVRQLTAAFVADSLGADLCGQCGRLVEDSWRRCPDCATWLAAPCAGCGLWSGLELAACPWCGEAERVRPLVGEPAPLVGAAPLALIPQPLAVVPGAQGSELAALGRGFRWRAAPDRSSAGGEAGRRDAGGSGADAAVQRPRLRTTRTRQRRAPGIAGARSFERGSAGGQSGARTRP